MSAKYGWFIKHARTGQFVRFDANDDSVTVVSQPREATMFDLYPEAADVAVHIMGLPLMAGVMLGIVDATIHDDPIPDVDTTPVPTREEILAAAHAGGEERRIKHAAARMAFNAQPSGLLIPHPGEPEVPKRKRARK